MVSALDIKHIIHKVFYNFYIYNMLVLYIFVGVIVLIFYYIYFLNNIQENLTNECQNILDSQKRMSNHASFETKNGSYCQYDGDCVKVRSQYCGTDTLTSMPKKVFKTKQECENDLDGCNDDSCDFKDKGKKGKVLEAFPSDATVIVERVNVVKRHQRASRNFQGGIIEKALPISVAKLMVVCPKCSEPTRVKKGVLEGKKVRACIKCDEVIDKV